MQWPQMAVCESTAHMSILFNIIAFSKISIHYWSTNDNYVAVK